MSRIVLFDAVGTILRPVPDVITAYHRAGESYGSKLSAEQVAARFRSARQFRFNLNRFAGETESGSLRSSDEVEYELWRSLIADVFDDVANVDDLFKQLWDHFAAAENWSLYDDVTRCWTRLSEQGFRIAIASNFDSRLIDIVKRHETLALSEAVFCSAEVGFRKPDPEFYRAIESSLGIDASDEVHFIGDDKENDFHAPVQYGWKAFYLDRRYRGSIGGTNEIDSLDRLLIS
jgi:putative hydrolase of the HAD superfamily